MRTKDPVTDVANECSLVHDFMISSYVYRKGTLAQIEQEIHRGNTVISFVASVAQKLEICVSHEGSNTRPLGGGYGYA